MAIWFKQKPVDEEPFVYVEEKLQSLEIVDSSDDEEDIKRKTKYNESGKSPQDLYPDKVFPDIYFSNEREETLPIYFRYYRSVPICWTNYFGSIAIQHIRELLLYIRPYRSTRIPFA